MTLLGIPADLLNAGFAIIAIAILLGLITAIIRGDLVPGVVYKRETTRADQATVQLERNTETIESLTEKVSTVADLLRALLGIKGAR